MRLGCDARGESFADEAADGRQLPPIHFVGGELLHEFAEAEAIDADQGGGTSGAGDLVGGGAVGRENEDRSGGGPFADELRRAGA
jgi:hypothetical protein